MIVVCYTLTKKSNRWYLKWQRGYFIFFKYFFTVWWRV